MPVVESLETVIPPMDATELNFPATNELPKESSATASPCPP
jgi:hypothetical protein